MFFIHLGVLRPIKPIQILFLENLYVLNSSALEESLFSSSVGSEALYHVLNVLNKWFVPFLIHMKIRFQGLASRILCYRETVSVITGELSLVGPQFFLILSNIYPVNNCKSKFADLAGLI